jgi:DNA polymerase-1
MALNSTIQGSAADLIKLAMVRLDSVLRERHPEARLLLQVHDELLFELPAAGAQAVAETVRATMENVAELTVPLRVDCGLGQDWVDAHA